MISYQVQRMLVNRNSLLFERFLMLFGRLEKEDIAYLKTFKFKPYEELQILAEVSNFIKGFYWFFKENFCGEWSFKEGSVNTGKWV